ncbi:MAG: hypothetical protein KKF89_06120 [Nanoarchaeota archaeon]|nr:hypothetical protein [Nanoarchaeota archaeon]MBU1855275.1 hypothetical protein [Nanoarchaeota archaeon]
MKKRGAYFFVLDALIGGAIFLISIILIIGSYLNTPQTLQAYETTEDIMNLLLNTKVTEFQDPERIISYLAKNGYITNSEQTLFEQISELHYKEEHQLAYNLTKSILNSILEEQYGINYTIYEKKSGINTTIYNRSGESIENSNFMLSSKKITFLVANETTFFGPDITELRVWN